MSESDWDDSFQLVGRRTTASLRPTAANVARVQQAVAEGRLLPTEHPTVFRVPQNLEAEDDLQTRKGRRRERVGPLARASAEGSGRWISDGPHAEPDWPAA